MGVKPQKPAYDVFNGGLGAGLWSCGDAKQEARQLASMLGKNGDTVESLRELIAVTPQTEALLRTLCERAS